MVKLAKLKSGGPFTMTIAGGKGSAPITINDVLVGEVWLGSGQSNMVFNVSNTGHRPYGLLDEKRRRLRRRTIRRCGCLPWRTRSR